MGVVLSGVQSEVLKLISQGFTSEEISNKVFRSKRTIENIRETLFRLTDTRNSAHLVAVALRSGLLK